MSVETISLVLNHSQAKGTDKLVLIGIANHDGDGGAWPSIETLARYANVSERSVQFSIGRLIELGELEVSRNKGGTGATRDDRRPNLYKITLTNGVKPTSPRDADGVKPTTPRGEVQRTDGVKPTSPEPSLEPSITFTPPTPSPIRRLTGDPEFERFCEIYPRVEKPRLVLAAWEAAIRKADPDHIIDRAKYLKPWLIRDGVQYAPPAHVWLNDERWADNVKVTHEMRLKAKGYV